MSSIHIIQIGMDEALALERERAAQDYDAFREKFKPKLTTDDCYTPAPVYDVVADWVAEEYHIDRARFVRPFWPGGDYEQAEYPDGHTVVDNPPFSIISRVCMFYHRRNIPFFLFAPALTLFAGVNVDACYIPCGAEITYENGAEVPTSFITNLEEWRVRTAPELRRRIDEANTKNVKSQKVHVPKYDYPNNIVTAAMAQRWSRYGVEYRLARSDCVKVRALDAQKAVGKSIFGSGFLLSERAAAERAAAERAAAERAAVTVWQLSERELQIVAKLGGDD